MAGSGKTDATALFAVGQAGEFERWNCKCLVGERGAAIHVLKVLAQDTRVKIVCRLMAGERSVSELAAVTSLHQSRVSQNLARLRQEGLVSSRRDGNAILYTIADHRVNSILRAVWELNVAGIAWR
jgi:DNA-binding transcriptional ArsR family regulator